MAENGLDGGNDEVQDVTSAILASSHVPPSDPQSNLLSFGERSFVHVIRSGRGPRTNFSMLHGRRCPASSKTGHCEYRKGIYNRRIRF